MKHFPTNKKEKSKAPEWLAAEAYIADGEANGTGARMTSVWMIRRWWNLQAGTPTERFVMHAILDRYSKKYQYCYPSYEDIAASTGFNISTVGRAVRALKAAGYLVVITGHGPGRGNDDDTDGRANQYLPTPLALSALKRPERGAPEVEPDAEPEVDSFEMSDLDALDPAESVPGADYFNDEEPPAPFEEDFPLWDEAAYEPEPEPEPEPAQAFSSVDEQVEPEQVEPEYVEPEQDFPVMDEDATSDSEIELNQPIHKEENEMTINTQPLAQEQPLGGSREINILGNAVKAIYPDAVLNPKALKELFEHVSDVEGWVDALTHADARRLLPELIREYTDEDVLVTWHEALAELASLVRHGAPRVVVRYLNARELKVYVKLEQGHKDSLIDRLKDAQDAHDNHGVDIPSAIEESRLACQRYQDGNIAFWLKDWLFVHGIPTHVGEPDVSRGGRRVVEMGAHGYTPTNDDFIEDARLGTMF